MSRRQRLRGVATALAALAWEALALPGLAAACAVCGTGPPLPGHKVPHEFFWGSLFMLVIPFAVFAGMGGWLGYMYWRAGRGRSADPPLRALWVHAWTWLAGIFWTRKESES